MVYTVFVCTQTFNELYLIPYLKENVKNFWRLHLRTDGCKAQYKNGTMFFTVAGWHERYAAECSYTYMCTY